MTSDCAPQSHVLSIPSNPSEARSERNLSRLQKAIGRKVDVGRLGKLEDTELIDLYKLSGRRVADGEKAKVADEQIDELIRRAEARK